MSSESGAAVVPMDDDPNRAEEVDPWRALADQSGVLVTWQPMIGTAPSWGASLAAGSRFAQQLSAVVERAGATLPGAGSTLFRVELPAGQVISDLIPAVGGGFRGMSRVAQTGRIASHGRLVQVSGAAVGVPAAIALGPLIGVLALTVVAEMVANKQQQDKLNAIAKGVEGLVRNELDGMVAQLKSAEHALQLARMAMLDQVVIPQAIGFGSAMATLNELRFKCFGWIDTWEHLAEAYRKKRSVEYGGFVKALDNVALGGFEAIGLHLQIAYQALTLHARAQVVALCEAQLTNPDRSVRNLHAALSERLRENAHSMDRLKKVARDLADVPLGHGRVPNPMSPNKPAEVQLKLSRLAWLLAEAPAPPPVLGEGNRSVLELERKPDGSLRILEPGSVS